MFGIPEKHIDQLEKTGYDPINGTIEECAELIQAISKPQEFEDQRDKIVEEMAHVLISMNLLARDYSINSHNIRAEVLRKAMIHHYDTSEYDWS